MSPPNGLSLEEIESTLEKDPNNAEAWRLKGDILLEKLLVYDSLKCYTKSVSCDPTYPYAWKGKGLASLFQDNLSDALQCFDLTNFLVNDTDFEAFRFKAHTYTWNKYNRDKIKKYLDKASQLNPEDIRILTSQGLYLKETNFKKEALSFFDKVLSKDPKNLLALLNIEKINQQDSEDLTINYIKNHFPEQAEQNNFSIVGDSLFLQFDFKSAADCYDYILKDDPKNGDILKKRAILYLLDHDFKNSLEILSRYLSINPTDSDGWTRKGEILRRQNKSLEAISCFDKAIEIDEKNPEAWRRKGFSYRMRHENLDEAIKCIDKSLKIDPYHPVTLVQESVIMGKGSKSAWEGALYCLDKALEIDPTFVLAWKQKSGLYTSTQNFEAAKVCWENILRLDPDDTISWYYAGVEDAKLAEFEFQKGVQLLNDSNFNKALECFENVLKIDPDDNESNSYRQKILTKLGKS